MLDLKDVTVAGANKKNLISALLFGAGCFPLLSSNEVTQAVSWPLAGAGRAGKGRRTLVHAMILLYFPFPSKRISLRRTTDAFSRPAASSRLLFPLCLSFAGLWSCPSLSLFSVSPFIAFYVLSYLSGTRHKYISAQQTVPLNFATCTPCTYPLSLERISR